MIKQGDVIKHKATMDVAVKVFYTSVNPDTGYTLVYGTWINQGQVLTYPLNCSAEFFIKPEHLNNWLKCKNPDSKFIRNEEWNSIV